MNLSRECYQYQRRPLAWVGEPYRKPTEKRQESWDSYLLYASHMGSTVHVLRHGEVFNPEKFFTAYNQAGTFLIADMRWLD